MLRIASNAFEFLFRYVFPPSSATSGPCTHSPSSHSCSPAIWWRTPNQLSSKISKAIITSFMSSCSFIPIVCSYPWDEYNIFGKKLKFIKLTCLCIAKWASNYLEILYITITVLANKPKMITYWFWPFSDLLTALDFSCLNCIRITRFNNIFWEFINVLHYPHSTLSQTENHIIIIFSRHSVVGNLWYVRITFFLEIYMLHVKLHAVHLFYLCKFFGQFDWLMPDIKCMKQMRELIGIFIWQWEK